MILVLLLGFDLFGNDSVGCLLSILNVTSQSSSLGGISIVGTFNLVTDFYYSSLSLRLSKVRVDVISLVS